MSQVASATMQIEELDEETRAWIGEKLQLAEQAGISLSPPELYQAFERTLTEYLSANATEEIDQTPFVAVFGVAVGEYLRQELEMEWKIITDDYGTDLAILRPAPDGTQVFSCPVVVVGKRFSGDYEPGQLAEFCEYFLTLSRAQLQPN